MGPQSKCFINKSRGCLPKKKRVLRKMRKSSSQDEKSNFFSPTAGRRRRFFPPLRDSTFSAAAHTSRRVIVPGNKVVAFFLIASRWQRECVPAAPSVSVESAVITRSGRAGQAGRFALHADAQQRHPLLPERPIGGLTDASLKRQDKGPLLSDTLS